MSDESVKPEKSPNQNIAGEQPAPPQSPATVAYCPDEAAGMKIGPYELLQTMGEGGMGAVWMAEQTEPVRRRVALKIIKAGLGGEHILARFEAERQALAMMDHPNIAKVLDAGATAFGRPYFVMELVKGIPFTKFCDQEHLTPAERLALFIPVCNAVQHAHQKGIIHRDLKPSNVLIALYDGRPVPKVIDFGVAKATQQRLTERTMFTEVGQIVGTLEYMAPEQAELNNLDIDTRADIYSLGVMLYELLTGAPPFTGKQLRGVALGEMLRLIREVEPSRPSTKLSSSEDLPAIAAKRKLEPKKLARLVQGDLDWIVMKCLEKDRGRRYETANQLGQELQRFLADEPVQAGPPSPGYRLKKFLRRNKGPAVAAALVLLVLIAGIIGTSIGLVQAERATDAEKLATQKANDNAGKLKDERDKVRGQRDEVRTANEQLRASQARLRRTLYHSQMHSAESALEANDIPRVRELLDQQLPKEGEADLRGFEWDYLRRACHTDRLTFVADPVASNAGSFSTAWSSARLCYSPDGKHLVSSWPNVLRFHDADTGKEVRAISYPRDASDFMGLGAGMLAYSPEGKYVAAATPAGIQGFIVQNPGKFPPSISLHPGVKILDAQTGREVRAVAPEYLLSISFSSDGKQLVTLSADVFGTFFPDPFGKRDLRIDWWDLGTGARVKTLKPAGIKFNVKQGIGFHFSRDGKRLAVQNENEIHLIQPETGENIRTFKSQPLLVALSANGSRLAAISHDVTLTVWDTQNGELLFKQPARHSRETGVSTSHVPSLFLSFSSDGKHLAVSWDQTIRLLDTQTGREQAVFRGHQSLLTGLAFRPDGQRIAAMARDGRMKVWDVQPADAPFMVGGPLFKLKDARLSPDGQLIAGFVDVQGKKEIRALDLQTRQQVFTLKEGIANATGLVFSPDSNQVAFLSRPAYDAKNKSGKVEVWNVRSGRQRIALPVTGRQSLFGSLAFSSDGDRLALGLSSSGSEEPETKVWDLRTGKDIHTLKGADSGQWIALSPDGKRLACVSGRSADKSFEVRLWNLEQRRLAVTLKVQSAVRYLTFSPDGKRFSAAGWKSHDATELWDLETGQRVQLLKGHLSEVVALAFSRDGKRLATSDFNGIVKVWDAQTGEEALTLQDNQGARGDLAFTRDGHLIRINYAGRVKIWNAAPLSPEVEAEEEAASLVSDLIRDLTAKAEVIERIKAETGFRASVRQAALDVAERYREDPQKLDEAAWKAVKSAGRKAEDYRLALRQAQAACAIQPENGGLLTTVGAAQYRQGRFADAVATLTRSEKINSQLSKTINLFPDLGSRLAGPRAPADLGFLAMAHYQLGHREQAQSYLERLRELVEKSSRSRVEEARSFLAEAETLLKGAGR
jgi:WD40 repeat protein/serine/threonine protein kinase